MFDLTMYPNTLDSNLEWENVTPQKFLGNDGN